MPNLIPQSVLDRFYFGWAHPAGRLIFALLALAIGMSFVLALIRPPLEHKILRPEFKEPRVHFAINCASVGCPPLAADPYRPTTLDAQLALNTVLEMFVAAAATGEPGTVATVIVFELVLVSLFTLAARTR